MKTTDPLKLEMERIKRDQSLHVISTLSTLLYKEHLPNENKYINRLGLSSEEEKSVRKKILNYMNQL